MVRLSPTLSDVAQRAGVSYATADRVVNGRGGVSDKAIRNVQSAIEDLGYIRNVAAANLSQRRIYRFVAVLPEGSNAFFARVRMLFQAAAGRLLADRVTLTVETVAAFDPGALRERLAHLAQSGVDGIALVGSDDSQTVEAIADLRSRDVSVVTLVSDVPGAQRSAYIGIDNAVAGRTAGRLIVLAHGGRRGRVLPVVGALSARDHADRIAGMREIVQDLFEITPVIEGRDRQDLVEAEVARALADDRAHHRDLQRRRGQCRADPRAAIAARRQGPAHRRAARTGRSFAPRARGWAGRRHHRPAPRRRSVARDRGAAPSGGSPRA